jgi:hypothetical protein
MNIPPRDLFGGSILLPSPSAEARRRRLPAAGSAINRTVRGMKGWLTVAGNYARLQETRMGLVWYWRETAGRKDFSNNWKRRATMGDKGGKKDKEKSQKQNSEKQQKNNQNKLDKQPKRKPWEKNPAKLTQEGNGDLSFTFATQESRKHFQVLTL